MSLSLSLYHKPSCTHFVRQTRAFSAQHKFLQHIARLDCVYRVKLVCCASDLIVSLFPLFRNFLCHRVSIFNSFLARKEGHLYATFHWDVLALFERIVLILSNETSRILYRNEIATLRYDTIVWSSTINSTN